MGMILNQLSAEGRACTLLAEVVSEIAIVSSSLDGNTVGAAGSPGISEGDGE